MNDTLHAPEHSSPLALLTASRICKAFRGVQALADVRFTVQAGEVHALLGENGAGKSTLIKVLTGVHRPDAGTMLLDGQAFAPRSPIDAQRAGVSTVYQEINLVPYLSVAENIYLGRQPRRALFGIRWREIRQRATAALEYLGITIDVSRPLASYSTAIQQMTAIARALDLQARLLILDEPTSSLDSGEVQRLLDRMRFLAREGLGIVFVTHFLGQVYEVSDRITVLRNGRLVGEYATSALPQVELVAAMLGGELSQVESAAREQMPPATEARDRTPLIQVDGLRRRKMIESFDMTLDGGEIVGLAGLLGSGRTETAKLLFGLEKPDAGRVLLDGKRVHIGSPARAVRLRFAFCPENRRTHGVVPELSVRENLILAVQGRRGWWRPVTRRLQERIAAQFVKALNIATPDAEQQVRNLSGGNQQKVILARWLASEPRFMILDEPTRGIDVGARAEIERLLLSLASDGVACLLISSELDEIVRCSSRVIVLRDCRKVGELAGHEASEGSIMRMIALQGSA